MQLDSSLSSPEANEEKDINLRFESVKVMHLHSLYEHKDFKVS